ncbi:MAG: isoprenylcysteine carboxylmethyltransferase family protein [Synergistaceae bacterium]|nr:isoprenylcysteine carboxylmethyltransferase family protein [Synergistaceae bacterium]
MQGIKVFTLVRGKKLIPRLLEGLLMPALVFWTMQVAATALGQPRLSAPLCWDLPALSWFGLALSLAGNIIFIAATISFGTAWRVGIDERGSNHLVTTGAFALSRNPVFVFMNLYFCGIFLIYPTWFFLVFFLIAAACIHLQILNEEKFLHARFGQTYEKYQHQVRRYL